MKQGIAERWGLYVITDEVLGKGRTHAEMTRMALEGGADVVQLRDKTSSSLALYNAAMDMKKYTGQAGKELVLNDRLDIAIAVGANVIHVGQEDLPTTVTRKLCGSMILGVSAGSVDEALRAEEDGADYLGVGPIYEARGTKANAREPAGLSLLEKIRKHTKLPIIAIGGIKLGNVRDVLSAGADTVAVISAIVAADDITAEAARFREVIDSVKSGRS